MPRHARALFPGVPHHVTQRGNHRELVFFSPGDQETYLRLLRENVLRYSVEVVAYCLMPNHVHLVVIPSTAGALHRLLKAVHGHYAQRINRMRALKGHLWQGRYFSSPLDPNYFRNAVRYVERNPVCAGLVHKAEEYAWSSAAAHCGQRVDMVVDARPKAIALAGIADWAGWLAEGLPGEVVRSLRDNCRQNLPCGSDAFLEELERSIGRTLRHDRPGRKPGKDSARNQPAQLHLPEFGERPLLETGTSPKSGNVPS